MDNVQDSRDFDEREEATGVPEGVEGEDEDVEIIPEGDEVLDSDEQDDQQSLDSVRDELASSRDDYVRLYAEFDNYKKRAAKDREELVKYSNESLIHELLNSLDHLEIALKHAQDSSEADAPQDSLVQGVDMTLRELRRTLDKFGLKVIEAEGKIFDPEYHHAMTQVERDDIDDNLVVEVLRTGYIFNGKVLRASMVSVSKKPEAQAEQENVEQENEDG